MTKPPIALVMCMHSVRQLVDMLLDTVAGGAGDILVRGSFITVATSCPEVFPSSRGR